VIIGIVITLVVLLAIAVIVGVARDPGPDPADVAIGYARALGTGDFDAVYRLVDPDLLDGRNRQQWIDEQAGRPHLAFAPDTVEARSRTVGDTTATVTLAIGADRAVPVELVRRQRVWTVAVFDGVPVAAARR
jgi:hypothetical protein